MGKGVRPHGPRTVTGPERRTTLGHAGEDDASRSNAGAEHAPDPRPERPDPEGGAQPAQSGKTCYWINTGSSGGCNASGRICVRR